MSRKVRLDSITVSSPCFQEWDSMKGNDRVRFCDHCSLKVHNLSEMTRSEALRVVAKSKGQICVRYYRNPRGRILTKPAPQRLHRIGRRVSRLVAGAFSASLSVAPVVAQGRAVPVVQQPVYSQPQNQSTGTVVGTITDINGAVIVGATISLTGSVAFYVSTDDSGEFRIPMVAAGRYRLHIEAPNGFAPLDTEFDLSGSGETRIDRTLQVPSIAEEVTIESGKQEFVVMGGAGVMSPDHPFVKAAQEDEMETLIQLVPGTDVNLRDESSHTTALEHAVQNGNREMVQFLLGRGADVNARDEQGRTVLMMFDEDSTSDLIWDLINAGADVNAKDNQGNTPLILAAYEDNIEALKTLLEAGAVVNAKNDEGQTALMMSAQNGLINNVRALIIAGADLIAKDNEGRDALAHAMEEESRAVVRYLRSLGAQPIAKKEDQPE